LAENAFHLQSNTSAIFPEFVVDRYHLVEDYNNRENNLNRRWSDKDIDLLDPEV